MTQSLTKDVGTDEAQPSLGELVATASKAASELFRAEIELAKTELKQEARKAAIGGGAFGGAGFLGIFALLLLSFAAAYGVAESPWFDVWAGFAIIGGAYLLLAAVLGLVGLKSVKRIGPPEATVRTTKETVERFKSIKENRGRREQDT